MAREEELRQELLRRLSEDREVEEYERGLPPFMQEALERGFEPGHVYDNELADFVTDNMNANRAAYVRAHIAECPRCAAREERERREMEELTLHRRQKARQREVGANTSKKQRRLHRLPALPALTMCGAALLLVWLFHSRFTTTAVHDTPHPYIAHHPITTQQMPAQSSVEAQLASLPRELKQMLAAGVHWSPAAFAQLENSQRLLGQDPPEERTIEITARKPVGIVVVDYADFAWELPKAIHVDSFELTCMRLDPQSHHPTTRMTSLKLSKTKIAAKLHLDPGEYLWSVSGIQDHRSVRYWPRSKLSRFYVLSQKDGVSELALAAANLWISNFPEARRYFSTYRSQQQRLNNTAAVRQAEQWLQKLDGGSIH